MSYASIHLTAARTLQVLLGISNSSVPAESVESAATTSGTRSLVEVFQGENPTADIGLTGALSGLPWLQGGCGSLRSALEFGLPPPCTEQRPSWNDKCGRHLSLRNSQDTKIMGNE